MRPGADLDQRLLGEVQRARRGVGLEVGPGAVAFDRVAAVLRDLPLELDRTLQRGLRQVDLHAAAGGLHVADVDQAGQRRRPQPGQRTAAGVQRQVVLAVEPARRHHPAVLVLHVPLLRVRVGVLVPRVPPVHRIAQRIGLDEHLLIGPVVVIRTAQQDSDAEVDVHQRGRDQLAVDDDAGGDEHLAAPVPPCPCSRSCSIRGPGRSPSSRAGCGAARPSRSRAAPRRRSRTGRRASARPSS